MNTAECDIIIKMCRDNDVSMVGIFGSTARGGGFPVQRHGTR